MISLRLRFISHFWLTESLFPFASFAVTFKIYATILLNGIAFLKKVSFKVMLGLVDEQLRL